jgi:hypothetical protein
VAISPAPGALARANAQIRAELLARHDAGQPAARQAIALADGLLERLEQRLMQKVDALPRTLLPSVRALRRAARSAGIHDPQLRTERGVIGLMDDIYILEEQLLRHCRRRAILARHLGHPAAFTREF